MARTFPASLIPSTFEKISLSAGTGVSSLNSTVVGSNPVFLRLSVSSGDVRFRHDGSNPNDTGGVFLAKDNMYELDAFGSADDLKFSLNDTETAATIDVQAYTRAV
jgi:hypothetical protein